jgi:hypothetical protein
MLPEISIPRLGPRLRLGRPTSVLVINALLCSLVLKIAVKMLQEM